MPYAVALVSGTHWIWEIVRMLVKGKLELASEEMWNSLFLYADPAELDRMESPRILCTHRRFNDLPSDFILHKRKLVLSLRDPKDVCVSWYKFLSSRVDMKYQGTFDGFITLFLQGKGAFFYIYRNNIILIKRHIIII